MACGPVPTTNLPSLDRAFGGYFRGCGHVARSATSGGGGTAAGPSEWRGPRSAARAARIRGLARPLPLIAYEKAASRAAGRRASGMGTYWPTDNVVAAADADTGGWPRGSAVERGDSWGGHRAASSAQIERNPRQSTPIAASPQRDPPSPVPLSRAETPRLTHNRGPASHPGGRRFESG
jgi:hypothetical protein